MRWGSVLESRSECKVINKGNGELVCKYSKVYKELIKRRRMLEKIKGKKAEIDIKI